MASVSGGENINLAYSRACSQLRRLTIACVPCASHTRCVQYRLWVKQQCKASHMVAVSGHPLIQNQTCIAVLFEVIHLQCCIQSLSLDLKPPASPARPTLSLQPLAPPTLLSIISSSL